MRIGEPTWSIRLGPFDILLSDLTQISFPRNEAERKSVEELTEDIRKNGLKNPLSVNWRLEPTQIGELRIYRGNQRIQALKKLGWVKVPCYVTIEGYKESEIFGVILRKIFKEVK